ncbi:MAG: 2Fe-2S iron-sulfur cluster binding domain-containing protein [Proteobacteria bacterium]|nr:2Fe-2S iron-sulfur cluster binding domain-containing protein [Pseudomonadota bacterium]
MAVLNVIDRDGKAHQLETVEGWRVMELLRDQNMGVEGICGGACDCASCHVIVAEDWAARLPEPREDELFKLDELPEIAPTSRLSCQIIWSDGLDGLSLTIAESA